MVIEGERGGCNAGEEGGKNSKHNGGSKERVEGSLLQAGHKSFKFEFEKVFFALALSRVKSLKI
jgi:hypothetical protein